MPNLSVRAERHLEGGKTESEARSQRALHSAGSYRTKGGRLRRLPSGTASLRDDLGPASGQKGPQRQGLPLKAAGWRVGARMPGCNERASAPRRRPASAGRCQVLL
jgi:hypothetical protein